MENCSRWPEHYVHAENRRKFFGRHLFHGRRRRVYVQGSDGPTTAKPHGGFVPLRRGLRAGVREGYTHRSHHVSCPAWRYGTLVRPGGDDVVTVSAKRNGHAGRVHDLRA